MIAPGKAMPLLARLREWLEANADAVMAAVFLALGAALVLKAFGSL